MSILPASEIKTPVLIVGDQTSTRQMLAALVAAMPGFVVVGEAASVDEALQAAAATKARVVVLDWMLLGSLGLKLLRSERANPLPYVFVISANPTDLAVRESLTAAGKGYLEKNAALSKFTSGPRTEEAGEIHFRPAIAHSIHGLVSHSENGGSASELSPRERDVLRFIAEGLSSKEIADRLALSVRTVENHRASIARRTGLRSIAQLTLHAVRLGLVETPTREN